MNYQEYQTWVAIYNSACTAYATRTDMNVQEVIDASTKIADAAINKMQGVKIPDASEISSNFFSELNKLGNFGR